MTSTRRCPAPAGTAPSSPPPPPRAGAVAVLTDPAGARRRGRRRACPRWSSTTRGRCSAPSPRRSTATRPRRLTVIGVTGTAGKTSTAYLVESGLRAAGLDHRADRHGGDPARRRRRRQRPDHPGGHRPARACSPPRVERGVTAVVMEVSSHALAMGRVGGVRFAVGGYTNFGLDHLDFHADAGGLLRGQGAALRRPVPRPRCSTSTTRRCARCSSPTTVTYSAAGDPTATWYATDVARRRRTASGSPRTARTA